MAGISLIIWLLPVEGIETEEKGFATGRELRRGRALRGIGSMLGFYTEVKTFWGRHGRGNLDWERLAHTYTNDNEFRKMFEKKRTQAKILWQGKGMPNRTQMKSIIKHLNKHPEKTRKISAAVEVMKI